jgi:uncharacterized protein YndB with AHSA1/START domain
MSDIDLQVEIEIAAAPADVAAVMFDPAREREWMPALTAVEIVDPALAPGARVRRQAAFLGRTLTWTTTVQDVRFPHLLTLQMSEGPFEGTVRYDIQRSASGSRVRIRSVGRPTALGFLPAALIAAPMRATLENDLGRLKALVESAS